MSRTRVLLADDHRMVAECLSRCLEPEFEVVGIAGDGRELLARAEQFRPDVIVSGVSMPRLNGIEAAAQLRKNGSMAKLVFLTMHREVHHAARAFQAGASGYCLKHAPVAEVLTAIREAIRGRTYVTPLLARQLSKYHRDHGARKPDPVQRLTARQREVLQLLAEGRSAKQIASLLSLSARTVEYHKYRMMSALGVATSAGLLQFAIRNGLAGI
jgi:DNA-binding NarL/FixJ family response regulator